MIADDLTGQRFGRLLVEGQAPSKGERTHWICKCDCGGSAIVASRALKAHNTMSCGCFHRQRSREVNTVHGMAARVGKQSEHPMWTAWQNMKRRCDDPKNNRYAIYGGRGIAYDPCWKQFLNFKADMEETWQRGLTLERKDVNGNYCKDNCKWATRKEQMRNKRANHRLTLNGVCKSVAEWAEALKVTDSAIQYRLKQGWSVEDTLTKPFRIYPKRC